MAATSAMSISLQACTMNKQTESEPGFEHGVSACFAGTMPDGSMIMAGGANFPDEDPLAPTAKKKLYKGIYRFDGSQWQRAGSLPEGIAYGAAVTMPAGIVLIGGTTESGATAKVDLLTPSLELEALPDFPGTIDNMAAAATGSKIYVAGGNFNGTPSRQLFVLDLDQPENGWKDLGVMPGNPRVQPAMAASEGRIYLWGGFAGRHDGHEPTLELDGLCYDPATSEWTEIEGPRNAQGEPVSTGGGVAATLESGTIAVAGGVNKDIFLAALIDQAPDYLNHPVEWYAFNPTVYYYHPSTSQWTAGQTDSSLARAGAAVIARGEDIVLIGGELKPRIRTSETKTVRHEQRY